MYPSFRVMPSHVTENVMSYLNYIDKDHNENKCLEYEIFIYSHFYVSQSPCDAITCY